MAGDDPEARQQLVRRPEHCLGLPKLTDPSLALKQFFSSQKGRSTQVIQFSMCVNADFVS
jgi:hypothetical protein